MISALLQAGSMILFLSAVAGFAILLKGCYVLRRQARRSSHDFTSILLKSPQMPMVSVIAVPVDSSAAARDFVRRLLELHCSRCEVVVVLNGPSEQDFQVWCDELRLQSTGRGVWESANLPDLQVLRTESTSWAGAYNAGLAISGGSLIAMLDAESQFVPDILLRLALPLLADEDTAAVCGTAPQLASNSLIEHFAGIEALRLYLARCAAFVGWNMLLPVQGCCVLLRRDAVMRAGVFASPLELILHLHGLARRGGPPFRMALVPEPVSWIAPSASESGLRHLIVRDQQSLASVLRHRRQIAGGIGALGWGLPALLYWRMMRPLLESAVYVLALVAIVTGLAPLQVGVLALLCTVGAGILVSTSAVVLRELAEYQGSDPGRLTKLFLASIPENLGYRQMRNLWLLQGFFRLR
jgi:hypothetical protein